MRYVLRLPLISHSVHPLAACECPYHSQLCSIHRKRSSQKCSSHSPCTKSKEKPIMVWFTWLFSINSVASARTPKRSIRQRRVCEHRHSSFFSLSVFDAMAFPMTMMVNMVHSFQWSKEKCRFLFISVLPSFSWMHAKHTHTHTLAVRVPCCNWRCSRHFTRLRSRLRARLRSFRQTCLCVVDAVCVRVYDTSCMCDRTKPEVSVGSANWKWCSKEPTNLLSRDQSL